MCLQTIKVCRNVSESRPITAYKVVKKRWRGFESDIFYFPFLKNKVYKARPRQLYGYQSGFHSFKSKGGANSWPIRSCDVVVVVKIWGEVNFGAQNGSQAHSSEYIKIVGLAK